MVKLKFRKPVFFDTASQGGTGSCLGVIHTETREDSSDNFKKNYGYDEFCRPLSNTTQIDDTDYIQSTQYDDYYGRVKGGQTVSGLTLETLYNDYGYAMQSLSNRAIPLYNP
jgi:hypothetical protein